MIRLASFLWLWFACLPSDALSQHLRSYLGFSYLGSGVSLHSCCSKAQPLLLTLDEGYLLTATPPDLGRGVAHLGPPASAQPLLLGRGVAPFGHRPWPRGVAPLGRHSWPQAWGHKLSLGHGVSLHGCSSKVHPLLLTLDKGYLLTTALPDPQRGIAPLGPPAPGLPVLLGRGVGPPGCQPWPWTWVALLGRSCAVAAWHSRLLPLTSDMGQLLLAAAPRAWGPPGFCPWPRTWGSSSRPHLVCRSQPLPHLEKKSYD